MLLSFTDGAPFATGATPYSFAPAEDDITPRILLQVEFEGVLSTAVVDTGAPYVVCSPAIARVLGLEQSDALEQLTIQIRGVRVSGNLYRMTLSFLAEEGETLDVDATAFVPDPQSSMEWGNFPSFVGLTGCLERMRFAVDPTTETFFFGPPLWS